jgi:uncharacterized protein DUF402
VNRREGERVVRRDVWHGRPWVGWCGIVVEDSAELLALYMPEGGELAIAPGEFPGGAHPWSGKERWAGHGVLQLQRPGEMHAVWVFWAGADRSHAAWYVNLQEPFRRTPIGFDTQDLELDLVVRPDGSWRWKDDELLDAWIAKGRWTQAEVAAIRAEGARVAAELEAGRRWWDDGWAEWRPNPAWRGGDLPPGWER